LDNLQAAILNIKLALLDNWTEERNKNAEFFAEKLKEYPVTLPYTPESHRHSFHLYVLRSKDAEEILKHLLRNGIESRAYYPVPLHLQECFGALGYKAGDFPESEKLSKECFTIPIYPELVQEEKEHVVRTIKQFFD
ncbi:MAG: DegT/DnrJ/EryC1/StrS family aminotransferase, partial [Omnitrophica bacterium]|nr:DegT/DnrJ/EryC1/StrS family aminotransferase [Candidatus Omnitrophota bacterium]